MSKSAIDNPFLTELKDKNGESWYHQIILEEKDKEIEKLNNRIHALEKHNKKLQLEAQKYFDLLMECEYGDKGD